MRHCCDTTWQDCCAVCASTEQCAASRRAPAAAAICRYSGSHNRNRELNRKRFRAGKAYLFVDDNFDMTPREIREEVSRFVNACPECQKCASAPSPWQSYRVGWDYIFTYNCMMCVFTLLFFQHQHLDQKRCTCGQPGDKNSRTAECLWYAAASTLRGSGEGSGVVRMMFLSVARLKKLLGQIMSKGVLHFSRIES